VYNRYLELKKGPSAAVEVWGKELNKSATVSQKEEIQRPKNCSTMSSMGEKLLERASFGTVCVLRDTFLLFFCICEWFLC